MLKRIYIDNFKSLVDFDFPEVGSDPLGKFVCLVGLNGAGKTTLLQALDFLAHLATGDLDAWLRTREWEFNELRTKRSGKSHIRFSVDVETVFGALRWSGAFNISEFRCTSEQLTLHPNAIGLKISEKEAAINFEGGVVSLSGGQQIPLITEHQGSAITSIKLENVQNIDQMLVILLKYYLSGVKSLELLSPNVMRRPSREAVDVGMGGEKLAAFVKGLSQEERAALLSNLVNFYPRLKRINAKTGKYGWTRLFFVEGDTDPVEIEAKHANDGLLRITAIVAQTVAEGGPAKNAKANERSLSEIQRKELGSFDQKRYQYILLEEIENGINPDLIEKLVAYLQSVPQQVFVTTHSPLLLNFLSDEVAADAVFFVFRSANGRVRVRRLFELNSLADKLKFMGPGEAYADTSLESLSHRLALEDGGR